jgi:1-acyl-sn-glycerol-3-phosphate acyltransferase
VKRQLYQFIFFRLLGWKIKGAIPNEVKKCVMMVMPHTSNYDFFLGLFTRGILNQEMNFVGKKELFVFPFGYYFKSIGGAPIDRSGGKNVVDAIVDIFTSRTVFRLAIAPEGTRKKVSELKTGFYYIALKANVPIVPVAFDYGTKEVRIGNPVTITGDYDSDMNQKLLPHFVNVKGRIPENQFND